METTSGAEISDTVPSSAVSSIITSTKHPGME